MSHFSLPPEISCQKQRLSDCWVYLFRHQALGELGRIVLKGLPNGHCHVASEVAGDPDDPMTEKRKDIFAPLSEQMTSILESTLGPGELGVRTAPARQKLATDRIK